MLGKIYCCHQGILMRVLFTYSKEYSGSRKFIWMKQKQHGKLTMTRQEKRGFNSVIQKSGRFSKTYVLLKQELLLSLRS